jgi:hypothetical protein
MDVRTPAQPVAPAQRGARGRARTRPVPERSQEHGHLGLPELRTYRAALQAEEHKVSYWRRILQARLDLVREGRAVGGGTAQLRPEALRPVLTDERIGSGRRALVQVLPVDDIPPLPDLAELWERRVPASDADGLTALEADLSEAERQLSEYRAALHARLESATGELIARYREQPALCLASLPGASTARGGRLSA